MPYINGTVYIRNTTSHFYDTGTRAHGTYAAVTLAAGIETTLVGRSPRK